MGNGIPDQKILTKRYPMYEINKITSYIYNCYSNKKNSVKIDVFFSFTVEQIGRRRSHRALMRCDANIRTIPWRADPPLNLLSALFF